MRRAGSPTTRGHPDASRAVHSRYGLLILPILCIGIVDAVWSRHIGLTINGWTWFATAVAFCVLVSVVYRKLRPAPPIARLASYAALWIVFTAVGCIFTYLAASVSRPLIDGYLTSFDHYLGFDWISWSNGVHRYMLLTVILRAAYDSLGLQIVASIVILSSGTGPDRNAELLLGAILSLVLVALISALWPTLGPWTPLSDQYASSDDLLIARDVLTMRAGGSTSFALARLRGIVTFPSYHTVLAILFAYAHRGRWSFPVFLVINCLMITSIPSEGGHYLSDVLAGAGLAVVAIVSARLILQRDTRGPLPVASAGLLMNDDRT
jgi:PAP2 superfamily